MIEVKLELIFKLTFQITWVFIVYQVNKKKKKNPRNIRGNIELFFPDCVGVQCDSGLCLWSWFPLCNGVVDCPDLSDEVNCGKRIFTEKEKIAFVCLLKG